MEKFLVLSVALLVGVVALTLAQTNCSTKKPKLTANQTYSVDVNCTKGKTYDEAGPPPQHCHCWGHCGYICQPTTSTSTTTTTKPVTTKSSTTTTKPVTTKASTTTTKSVTTKGSTTTTKKPGCPFGSPWIPPSQPTQVCICKRFNQVSYYDCTSNNSTTTSTETTTVAGETTTAVDTTTVAGETTTAADTTTDTTTVAAG